jgi:hypothetical protein
MPEIPDKPLDDLDAKKNKTYLKRAIKSQEKDGYQSK